MAIKATELDKDFRDSFEKEDGTIDESITDDSLDQYWHLSQEDHFGGEESEKVKKFFDYIARHVFLPWLSALTKVFNLFKATVERDYLKTEKVQRHYDSESADPMSGKAVAEAIQLTDTQTIWEGISRTGHYWEAEGSKFWGMSLQAEILRKVIGDFDGEIYDGNTDGWAYKVRIFVRNIDTNQVFFISAGEALEAAMGNFEPVPIFAGASQEELFDSLKELIEEKTLYIPIARNGEWFTVTKEMAESGLIVRVCSYMLSDQVYWSLEYHKEGYMLGELYGTEAFSTGDIDVDVAGYEGHQMKFTFSDLDGHGGTAQLLQPVVIRSVSSEKLAALLAEGVS
jgi:hypothetical protein